MTRLFLSLAALLAVALAAGCTTWHSGAASTYTLKRHLNAWETTVALPIDKVHKATVAGLNDLGLKPVTSRVDKLTGFNDGFLADGTDFEVRLESLGETVTRVRVRCGMLGDQERSVQLFRAIEKRF